MKRYGVGALLLVGAVLTGPTPLVAASEPQSGAQATQAKAAIPLKVDVVLSRFQGDKKIASLPYTLWVNATENGREGTSLRMGVDVPVGTVSETRPNMSGTNPTTTTRTGPDYRNVGTSIDCYAEVIDGRFAVSVRLTDSSIFTGDQEGRGAIRTADPMAFRTFSTSNKITMRDGQTVQFAVATDKITGEILKVDVTINAVK